VLKINKHIEKCGEILYIINMIDGISEEEIRK